MEGRDPADMPSYWTTADIARALGYGSDPTAAHARATARKWIERRRAEGHIFEFTINEKTGEKSYRRDQIEAAITKDGAI